MSLLFRNASLNLCTLFIGPFILKAFMSTGFCQLYVLKLFFLQVHGLPAHIISNISDVQLLVLMNFFPNLWLAALWSVLR